MADFGQHLQVTLLTHEHSGALVAEAVLESGLRHGCSASWSTDATSSAIEAPESGWTVSATLVTDAGSRVATSTVIGYDDAGCLLVAEWAQQRVSCRVLAHTSGAAASLLEAVRRLLPEAQT